MKNRIINQRILSCVIGLVLGYAGALINNPRLGVLLVAAAVIAMVYVPMPAEGERDE